MMTWLAYDSDFSSSFFLRPTISPLVLERKSLMRLLSTSSTLSFSLMIFSVLDGSTLDAVLAMGLFLAGFKKELFLVDGSVG